jgi:hypothetical protein
VNADSKTVERLLETTDRISRRVNALEATKREGPPFDRTPRPQEKSPERAFQDKEAAAGRLTEVPEPDRTGRVISRFYGDPSVWLDQFKCAGRRISNIRTVFDK